MSTTASASGAPGHAQQRPARARRVPTVTPLILALAAFNVLTVVLSVVGFTADLGLLSLLFPQASVFFPSAWDDYLGRAGIWFFFMAVGVLTTAIGAIAAPRGHRRAGAFRAMTICGAIVALFSPAVVGVLALL